ncbi:MAG TPA: helix-turn-helix domain-containing protein [Verrucomicrobiae bacterium]|jgi:excisionase family DNA binding protein|nr:helix-turn-helix domain-containing protein [Verrucomicrobiae bacterium]
MKQNLQNTSSKEQPAKALGILENSKAPVGEQPVNPADENLFWNKSELARIVRRSKRTVEIWMREGRIPFLRIGPRTVLFEKRAVLEALLKFQVNARP